MLAFDVMSQISEYEKLNLSINNDLVHKTIFNKIKLKKKKHVRNGFLALYEFKKMLISNFIIFLITKTSRFVKLIVHYIFWIDEGK